MPDEPSIDCRSEEGITVGLIDGIIAIARVAAKRPLHDHGIRQALLDLSTDEDVAYLLNQASLLHEPPTPAT